MSLPPALLQRLAQRGLVQKQDSSALVTATENEEVIAEDYDELDTNDQQHESDEYPSQYENESISNKKRSEDNFWIERMKARMGETITTAGYKGCPNKYNIWHKCTLYCLKRWGEGHCEPSRDYMRRYKRLLRKYPLPKGWVEMYDPGCGCFYFTNTADNVVSWLPPTHPKSQIIKTAATFRKQMEEASGEGDDSDGENHHDEDDDDDEEESAEIRHHREIDEIINSTLRPRSPQLLPPLGRQMFPNLQESNDDNITGGNSMPRKQRSRDLERTLSRQRRDRERDRDRERNRDFDRGSGGGYGHSRRRGGRDDVDPMDPSAYSDIPRGKWSDGLHTGSDERKKLPTVDHNTDRRDRERDGRDQSDEDEERDFH